MKAKRSLDVLLSILMLTFLLLPFAVVAILVKLDSKGPIFFRQHRTGKDGTVFRILKFRTMVDEAEKIGLGHEMTRDDARITGVGRRLRNWGLDELPQLVNVIMGDVSLVGPRASRVDQHEMFTDDERGRMQMRPGITGLAVVKGRNGLDWEQRIKLDLWYIENRSFWMDIRILFQTLNVVLIKRQGVYGPDGLNRDYNSSTRSMAGATSGNDLKKGSTNV